MNQMKVFIVEDDLWYADLLKYYLTLNEDYEVEIFETGRECLKNLYKKPAVITVDYSLPDIKGQELMRKIIDYNPEISVIIISGQKDVKIAVELLKEGAFDYIVKDEDTNDRLWNSLRLFQNNLRLREENARLKEEVGKKYDFTKVLIGSSPGIRELFSLMEKAANSQITISLTGETGTGKELVAKAIHYHSGRRKYPFIAVNLGAIPKDLVESELFGHEKGAFTGATERQTGKFELADGGTIFLDEIGDMSLRTQSKVLRVLEEGEIQRVGSNKIIKIDVRVIAATNKDLKKEMKEGHFREDLYFRLNVVPLYVPPLRDRKEDLPLLVDYFCRVFSEENNFKLKKFSPEALEVMMKYPWKGNVRELKNLVERLIIMNDREVITIDALPDYLVEGQAFYLPDMKKAATLREFRDEAEKNFILYKLKANGWNVSKTAREIDTPRSNLYKKLEQYGIKIMAGAGEAVAPSDEEEGEESPNSTGQDGR